MAKYEDNILWDERAQERFWKKVEVVNPNDPDACYDWKARKDKNSCGIFPMNCPQLEKEVDAGKVKRTWKSFRAPRIMWILEHDQSIPEGLLVIHSCDNETCTNPRHIRLGTVLDNARDRVARGRNDAHVKGEDHPNAKLTVAKVRKICHLYFVRKMQPKAIADKLGVNKATVRGVIDGKTWKHITKTHIPKGHMGLYAKCAHRNELMYKEFKKGATYTEIARKFDVSYVYTRQILRKKRAEHGDKPTPIGFRSEERDRCR